MDTIPAPALSPHAPRRHALPAPPPGVPPIRGWEHLLPQAVSLAWRHDPEVMSQLLASLLVMHLQPQARRMEATFDELHLMISLELQALAGYPE